MSNRKARVHTCKISQLITGLSDSRPTSLHSPVHHRMLFFLPLSPPRLCIPQPRQGQLKEMMPPHHKIYERFTPVCLPVYRIHWLPPKELLPSPVVYKAGTHLLGVTESMSPAACLLWQVLIENQTQVASGLNLIASLWLSVTTLGRITLGRWHRAEIIRRHVTKRWQYV